jgi:DNA polymerase III subunit delta'
MQQKPLSDRRGLDDSLLETILIAETRGANHRSVSILMWRGILGHDDVVDHFRRTLAAGRLASTYLFVGPPGVGKRRFARELAHALLCITADEAALEPCERCESCRLFAAGSHPDLDVVGLLPDKSELAISQFVGYDSHLKQEGLCHRIALKPFFGHRRIAIVDDADHFNVHSANCLLKTLEEPPPNSLLILIGTSPARQLPTIRSRSQVVRFRPLSVEIVTQILVEKGLIADHQQAMCAAELSDGSVEQALQVADAELSQFREQLMHELRAPKLDPVRLGRSVQAFVEEAGKEPAQRRARLRIVLGFAADYFRAELRRQAAKSGCANAWMSGAESIVKVLDRCLEALEHVERNANQALVIQAWCEDLAAIQAAPSATSATTQRL